MASQIRRFGVTALGLALGGTLASNLLKDNDQIFQKVSRF